MFSNILLAADYRGDGPDRPNRLYARLDQSEGKWVAFDAIAAEDFDKLPDSIPGLKAWANHSAKARIFVLWVELELPPDLSDAIDDLPHWLEIDLDWRESNATLYFNLFRPGLRVGVSNIRFAPLQRAAQLSNAFSLNGLERTKVELEAALGSMTPTVQWVGVYDVGQGNANATCDANETPTLYFDLGGGVTQHQNTFPSGMTDFCYALAPPVVLSHWDWDHWSSGARFTGAQALNWIVPLQTLGAVHATFAAGLNNAGRLFVWPNSLPSLRSGQSTIQKCTGQGTGRNHSGLALEVEGPTGEAPILLTGDARFSAIPNVPANKFTSLVVPHHGADMRTRAVPMGHHLPGARTAYSFGAGNSYGHPRPITAQDLNVHNWPQSGQGAVVPIDINTATGNRPGHIGLSWSNHPNLPGHSCAGQSCSVGLQQV